VHRLMRLRKRQFIHMYIFSYVILINLYKEYIYICICACIHKYTLTQRHGQGLGALHLGEREGECLVGLGTLRVLHLVDSVCVYVSGLGALPAVHFRAAIIAALHTPAHLHL